MKLEYPSLNNFFMRRSYDSVEPEEPIGLEPETTAFVNRVIADGGTVNDQTKLDNFYKATKNIGKYSALQLAVSKQFGYKVVGGNITKIYDASKNSNDLTVTGTVPEETNNDKFALIGAYFKKTSASMDLIGDKFTISTRINHPSPNTQVANYFIGLGELWARAGGSSGFTISYASLLGGTKVYTGQSEAFTNTNDAGVNRLLSFRHNKNVAQSLTKDGVVIPGTDSGMLAYGFVNPVTTITYGIRTDENAPTDADANLNDTFFFNDYLTNAELTAINNI